MSTPTDETPSKRHSKREIKGLKASNTKLETLRTDSVPQAAPAPSDEPTLEEGAPLEREIGAVSFKRTVVESAPVDLPETPLDGREIQGLDATNTRVESVRPEDATPMVIVDDPVTPAGGIPRAQLKEDGELSLSVLLGEVKSLRSRNQILRTERTSIAGRKYALEVVLETLKAKLEELGQLCETLDAPGELGAALASIREMVGDARRIALGRDLLEDELENEKAARLRERQELEQRTSDLEEQTAGLKAERDSLRERVSWLERERVKHQEKIVELEETAQATEELTALRKRVAELEDRTRALGDEGEAVRTERDDLRGKVETLAKTVEVQREETERAVKGLEEAVALTEKANQSAAADRARAASLEARIGELEPQLAQALQRLSETEARAEAAEGRAAAAESGAERAKDGLKDQLESATQRFGAAETRRKLLEAKLADLEAKVAAGAALEAKVQKQDALLKEQRSVLTQAKPMLEQLDKDNQRLTRLLGDARARGRVNVEELLQRAELLKRLERIAAATVE